MKVAAIIVNVFTLLGALVAGVLLSLLGMIFLDSHVDSDKLGGVVCFAVALVTVAIPIIGLVLATRKRKGLRILSLVMGIVLLVFLAAAIVIIPGAMYAAAMP